MILKKYSGKTIKEALRTAREKLGDEVILLDSRPPIENRPAVVTVMLDEKSANSLLEKPKKQEEAEFSNMIYKRSDVRKNLKKSLAAYAAASSDSDEMTDIALEEPLEDTISGSELFEIQSDENIENEANLTEKNADEAEGNGFDLSALKEKMNGHEKKSKNNIGVADDSVTDETKPMSRRTVSLIPDMPVNGNGAGHSAGNEMITREINALHRRFDQLEAMFNASVMSANLDYAAHPSFQQLLKTGIRSTTIAQWFREVMEKGIDPVDDSERFIYELARLVRDALSFTLPSPPQSNIVFVGPAGSGKTTLIMKLVRHAEFFGNKKVAIISVEPRQQVQRYTILKPFSEEHQVDLFTVKDGIDASKLMPKLSGYQQVLIDTPSISLEKKTAFREYWKLRQILAAIMPLEVHFVVNSTMENYYFRESYAANHPLQPDYLALTHLDETNRWGQLIPFLKAMGCGVRYLSVGPNVPDDINSYSPTWFAERILSPGKKEA